MKLFWGPHTCAIGIHILLEEIGRPYDTEKLDVHGGDNKKPPFTTLNPKAKVPVLVRDDGSVLTEYGAIATWLARDHPDKTLIPADVEAEVRGIEVMDYVVGTLHGQGFARIFLPARFELQDAVHTTLGLGQSAIKAQGKTMVEKGFAILEDGFGDKPYVAGDALTIADTALFYAERWAPQCDIALPPKLARHFATMKSRPAVQTVMAAWGETGE